MLLHVKKHCQLENKLLYPKVGLHKDEQTYNPNYIKEIDENKLH